MKKLICSILAACLFSNIAMADCDWSTGIKPLSNGNYEYTKECHIKVGETVRDLKISDEQVKKLTQGISLKDLALEKANQRADLWMGTSQMLEARIETMDSLYQRNKWLYFGLGVLATSAVIYGANQLTHR